MKLVFVILIVSQLSLSALAKPFRYKRVNTSGVVTNVWTEDVGDENYSEPSFGPKDSYSVVIEDMALEIAAKKAKDSSRADRVAQIKALSDKAVAGTLTGQEQKDALSLVLQHLKDAN